MRHKLQKEQKAKESARTLFKRSGVESPWRLCPQEKKIPARRCLGQLESCWEDRQEDRDRAGAVGEISKDKGRKHIDHLAAILWLQTASGLHLQHGENTRQDMCFRRLKGKIMNSSGSQGQTSCNRVGVPSQGQE